MLSDLTQVKSGLLLNRYYVDFARLTRHVTLHSGALYFEQNFFYSPCKQPVR